VANVERGTEGKNRQNFGKGTRLFRVKCTGKTKKEGGIFHGGGKTEAHLDGII